MEQLPNYVRVFLATVGYTVFGLVTFAIAFWLMAKMSPFSLRKEIEEDHNTALAVLTSSVILGIAVIIASVLNG